MSEPIPAPRFLMLACKVLRGEINVHRPRFGGPVATEWFCVGLHDQPDILRATLQEAIDRAALRDDISAVVLAYGLCGLGTAGLVARRHPLVIPRAHDCITVFLGAKEAYSAHQAAHPGGYYYTPGWNRRRRVPGPDRLEFLRTSFAKKFDEDAVDFLIESEKETWAMHDRATYIDLGTPDAATEAAYAKGCADWLGWTFEHIRGDATLLRDLLAGRWDIDRFQIVPPGEKLVHRPDAAIMGSQPESPA